MYSCGQSYKASTIVIYESRVIKLNILYSKRLYNIGHRSLIILDWHLPKKKICCYLFLLKQLNPNQSIWRQAVQ